MSLPYFCAYSNRIEKKKRYEPNCLGPASILLRDSEGEFSRLAGDCARAALYRGDIFFKTIPRGMPSITGVGRILFGSGARRIYKKARRKLFVLKEKNGGIGEGSRGRMRK